GGEKRFGARLVAAGNQIRGFDRPPGRAGPGAAKGERRRTSPAGRLVSAGARNAAKAWAKGPGPGAAGGLRGAPGQSSGRTGNTPGQAAAGRRGVLPATGALWCFSGAGAGRGGRFSRPGAAAASLPAGAGPLPRQGGGAEK